jgi:hypothetical protein
MWLQVQAIRESCFFIAAMIRFMGVREHINSAISPQHSILLFPEELIEELQAQTLLSYTPD